MAETLSGERLSEELRDLPGWEPRGLTIAKEYRFDDFTAALGFVVRLGCRAEAANHHPDVDIRYSRVIVTLSTHSAGGVTEKDVALAREAEALAGG